MAIKYSIPRGTHDLLPSKSYQWEYVESIFRSVVKNFGYQEICTPIFEHAEIFERSSGEATDIVQKEMYRFTDRKGRNFALRPEGTAPVVRSYIENNLGADHQITKLFYVGQMFRYDRPQAGRTRQFSQYGTECIGSNHPYYDAENIAVFYTFLQRLGLKEFTVEINSIGCSNCSTIYNQILQDYFEPYLDSMCPDCKNRWEKNPKRLLDCKIAKCQAITQKSPSMLDYLDESCYHHFVKVQEYLQMLAVPFRINSRIVRGLDYYSLTAFEFTNNALGSQNALGGGGRYNGLIAKMGGKNTPAVGFAGGFSRLILSLENEKIPIGRPLIPQYYLIASGIKTIPQAIGIVSFLRKHGVYVEFDPETKSLASHLKKADRQRALFVLILGEDELMNCELTIKNMTTGHQKAISLDSLEELLTYCPV